MDSNLEARRPRWYRRRWGIAVLTLVGALAVAVPVAWASDVFADVDTSNPFHNDINAIKGAGITQGCSVSPPLYCPSANVTREAMAAFIHRGFGRTGQAILGGSIPSTTEVVIGSRTITPGAVGTGTTGFIKADAAVNVYGCVCTGYAYLRRADTGALLGGFQYASPTNASIGAPGFVQSLSLTGVVPSGTSPVTIQVVGGRYSGTGTISMFGSMTVSYFPFGPTGTNAAGGAGATPTPLPAPGH